VESSSEMQTSSFMCLFCQCLEQCFYAEGNGLPNETLHTEEYKVSVIVLCSCFYIFLFQYTTASAKMHYFDQK